MSFTEFTCRSGGSNLYAGSLDGAAEAGTSPLVTYTNGGWNSGTGVYTPASGNPVSAGVAVGQWVSVYTDGASAPTGFVARVTAVSSTTITLSTSAKSGTAPTTAASGITAVVGGAWAGPNGATAFPFGFVQGTMVDAASEKPRINLKNDQTYSVTAAMTHANTICTFQGYGTAFGDPGRATVSGGTSGASYIVLTVSAGQQVWLRNLIFANNGATGTSAGVSIPNSRNACANCVFTGMLGSGCTGAGLYQQCEFYGNNTSNTAGAGGFLPTNFCFFERCVFHDNTGSNNAGLVGTGSATPFCVDCVFDSNGKQGVSVGSNGPASFNGCVFYGNGNAGVTISSSTSVTFFTNCIFALNGTYGFDSASGSIYAKIDNCAFYSNTSGQANPGLQSAFSEGNGVLTLAGDPFVDAANGDFRLNATAGAGAACRGAGIGTFAQTAPSYAGTVAYPDVGAVQHQDAGGSAGMLFVPSLDGV